MMVHRWLLPLLVVSGLSALASCQPTEPPVPSAPPASAPADTPNARQGSDWPRFLGLKGDGTSPERGIIAPWPKTGLKQLWTCELGLGYPAPVIVAGRLYHFDRFGDKCTLTCRDAETGKSIWQYQYESDYVDRYGYDPGPRACPVVDGERVYILGPEGILVCVATADGKELWKLDTREKYHFQQNFFGVGSVPVVDGDILCVAVGGSEKGPRPADFRTVKPNGTAIIGLDKKTGAVKYELGDELASYASPLIATIGGKQIGLYFGRGGLLGWDVQTGKQTFRYPWRSKLEESVNASTPVIVGDRVLITESYGDGAVVLDLKPGQPKVVWSDADKDRDEKALMCHFNTPVYRDGFVYASSGRHEQGSELRCVNFETGEVKWKKRQNARSSIVSVDGYLIVLTEYGELILLKANPEKYEEVSRFEVDGLKNPCWAAPVISRGRMYVRGKGKLVCLELVK